MEKDLKRKGIIDEKGRGNKRKEVGMVEEERRREEIRKWEMRRREGPQGGGGGSTRRRGRGGKQEGREKREVTKTERGR